MAKPLRPHAASNGAFVLMEDSAGNALFVIGTTVPTDTTAGYAKGCIFIDSDAAAGSILFCNEGTATSADFDAVSVA